MHAFIDLPAARKRANASHDDDDCIESASPANGRKERPRSFDYVGETVYWLCIGSNWITSTNKLMMNNKIEIALEGWLKLTSLYDNEII